MSTLLDAISKVKVGIWQFIRLIFSANREYPYHDFQEYYVDPAIPQYYVVGHNNVQAHGDQSKLFVSKSTLLFSTAIAIIMFNNPKNTPIAIVPNTWYEFKSNIWAVNVLLMAPGGHLYMYFEGVLPEEARSPE